MVSTEERERIIASVNNLQDETVEFLQEMVRARSENPPGDYTAIREEVSTQYENFGWDVETVWASEELLEELNLPHPRPNVLGYVSRGNGPTIALNAHLDTVPVNEAEWNVDPFGGDLDDSRVWGRGAKDSKGRIASYTLACRILEETGLLPDDATIVLAMTADEETGGKAGAGYVSDSGALRPDYAIVEGAGWNYIWHAGSAMVRYRVTVTGEAAHAGTRPERGSNAIFGAARLLLALEKHAAELEEMDSEINRIPNPTCTPSVIEGGVKTNVVPPSCSFKIDARIPPDYNVEEYDTALRKAIDTVEMPPGTSASVEVIGKSNSYRFDPQEPHIQALKQNADTIFDQDIPIVGTRGSTDAQHWARNGAKCVNYGPGDHDSNSHAANEHIIVEQVRDVGAVVGSSLLDIIRLD